MAMERVCFTMSEADLDLFERGRNELKMTKSAYIRYLIAEHEGTLPVAVKYKSIITQFSDLNDLIKQLLLTDTLTDQEKLMLSEQMRAVKEQLGKIQ